MDEMENKLMAVTGGKKPKLGEKDEARYAAMKKSFDGIANQR